MNYQQNLEKTVSAFTKPKTLLLHSCCAPCSSYVIEYLSSYFSVTVFYYNPNISTLREYEKRAAEQKRFIEQFPAKYAVSYIEEEYNPNEFLKSIKGFEKEPEGGKRCEKCFSLRLQKTSERAEKEAFDYFATTLTLSPLKNAENINNIGLNINPEKYLPSDFKKKDGYKRSIELSKEYNLYRQNFCGCIYSDRDFSQKGS